jgi:cell division transport system ATP-binding protein
MTTPLPVKAEHAFIVQHNHQQVLGDVNLEIRAGEFVYLTGKTGSGKSSFLKTLYGELPLGDGEVHVMGQPLSKVSKSGVYELRRKIGMVFQDFKLLEHFSAYENLDFVLKATDWKNKNQRHKRIKEVLEELSLDHKADHLPHELSGGEQQRLAVSRAILNKPPIILADEPTGNLDPDVADEIIGLLHYLSEKGAAVIMATHDYRLINKFPGTIYELNNARIKPVTFIA